MKRRPYWLLMLAPWLLLFDRWSLEHSLFCGDLSRLFLQMRNLPMTQLWIPSIFGGLPRVGDIQDPIFYPGNWLTAPFSPEFGLNLFILGHLILTGLGMRALLSELGLREDTCWVGGCLYSLAGTHLASLFQPPQIAVLAWLPWCAWSAECALQHPTRWGWVRTALLFAVQFLAGFPQANIYVGLASGLYLWGRVLEQGQARRAVLLAVACPAIGLLLASVEWAPFLELASQTPRHLIPPGSFRHSTWPWSTILGYFCPWPFRAPSQPDGLELLPYLGLVPFCLAVRTTVRQRSSCNWLWTAAVLGLWLTAYEVQPFVHLLVWIPVINKFKAPLRLLSIASFLATLLAMRAFDRVERAGLRAALAIALIVEAMVAGRLHLADVPVPERLMRMPTPFAMLEARSHGDLPERYVTLRGCHSSYADLGILYGLCNASGIHSTPTEDWIDLLALNDTGQLASLPLLEEASEQSFCWEPSRLDSPVLRLLNVGYAIAPSPDGDELRALPAPLPRAFLIDSVFVGDRVAQAARMASSDFRPDREATADGPLPLPGTGAGVPGSCRIESYTPDAVGIHADCQRPCVLVLSDAFYSGWEASVNGSPVPIARVDLALRGVVLPAGASEVRMRFRSRPLAWGAAVSLGALLLCLIWVVRGTGKRSPN